MVKDSGQELQDSATLALHDINRDGRSSEADHGNMHTATDQHHRELPVEYQPAVEADFTPESDSPTLNRKTTILLFISHFLSTWNSRLFEMGAVLFLAAIYPQTLLPISIYALSRNGAAIVFSTAIGILIDTRNRLVVVRASIIGQRVAVAGSCVAFLVMYTRANLSTTAKNGLFGLVVILACVEKVSSILNLVSVERDWVVVMTQDLSSQRQTLNARMRRIDLFCKLVGPLAISLVDGASTVVAIYLTLGMSCASIGIEYFTLAAVYKAVPSLQRTTATPPGSSNQDSTDATTFGNVLQRTFRQISPLQSLPFYLNHSAFLPSISLSLVYLTVLSFSGQMTTFLLSAGYTSITVGVARAISTVFELSATWMSKFLESRIGPVRAGIWSINSEALFLTAGMVWFVAQAQSHTQGYLSIVSASGLVAGVILSRVGLWSFDLSAQIIIQDEVADGDRGRFSTIEAAMQNIFECLAYVSTIVFSQPDSFVYPCLISLGAVYAAGGLYAWFLRRRRGHLLHRPMCLKREHQFDA